MIFFRKIKKVREFLKFCNTYKMDFFFFNFNEVNLVSLQEYMETKKYTDKDKAEYYVINLTKENTDKDTLKNTRRVFTSLSEEQFLY